jgi:hypothetical protein
MSCMGLRWDTGNGGGVSSASAAAKDSMSSKVMLSSALRLLCFLADYGSSCEQVVQAPTSWEGYRHWFGQEGLGQRAGPQGYEP